MKLAAILARLFGRGTNSEAAANGLQALETWYSGEDDPDMKARVAASLGMLRGGSSFEG